MVKSRGYSVAALPNVRQDRQVKDRQHFVNIHVDCHANLLTGAHGEIYFIVQKSYFMQDKASEKKLQSIARDARLKLKIIDDEGLPPLALNVLQFRDGKVVCSGDEEGRLAGEIAEVVGKDKVVATEIPLVHMPRSTRAGIRCMTNVASQGLMNVFMEYNRDLDRVIPNTVS